MYPLVNRAGESRARRPAATHDRAAATMDEFEPAILADLVGATYESAVDPGHWSQLVTGLERIYPDSRVTLFGHNASSPTANVGARVNYAESDLRSYADYYITCSPYIARSMSLPV